MELKGQIYRGRFAPSPSGPLHFGSLIAALGSFLQARSQQGQWLVRIEDLDPPREMPGADRLILNSLEAHGLLWDEKVMYQSTRAKAYAEALDKLAEKQLLFYCECSNKKIREQHKQFKLDTSSQSSLIASGVYPGNCRTFIEYRDNCSLRLRVTEQTILFNDQVYGLVAQDLATEVGDFVVKRRDDLFAYQLAVVVDDIAQNITEVVRGADLLDSTPRQLYIYQCLEAASPNYLHLPLALLPTKQKLSKQTGATALCDENAEDNLYKAMKFLGMTPPNDLQTETVESILNWGIKHWNVSTISPQDIVI